ncbi:MAG: LytR C-terminal domain-containing protein [Pseudonocardiaceae bacterium]
MGTPGSGGTGDSRRLRTAGLALFGLAVIAALIGLVLALTRGERTAAIGKPTVTPTHAPVSASTVPSVIPYPPPVISPPTEAPSTEAPSTEAPAVSPPGPPSSAEGPPAGDNGASAIGASRGEVRVYNNSTIRGLAARAARDLSAAGWTVVEVGNYARGTIPTTTVYYQEGTDQRAEAEALAAQFKVRVEPRFAGIENASPGLIMIVTNDYASP